MADNKQHDTRTARRPDCVTEIRMGNSVLVVSGYFKKDTTTTAADNKNFHKNLLNRLNIKFLKTHRQGAAFWAVP